MSRNGLSKDVTVSRDLFWRFYKKWLVNHLCESDDCDCMDIIQEVHVLLKQEEGSV